nr:MAG TPA: hypothetical protein [Caudoviricetes sp.]
MNAAFPRYPCCICEHPQPAPHTCTVYDRCKLYRAFLREAWDTTVSRLRRNE